MKQREQLSSALRLLLDSGDITPQGARIIRKILDEPAAVMDGTR